MGGEQEGLFLLSIMLGLIFAGVVYSDAQAMLPDEPYQRQIVLRVTEPTGVDRRDWPVTSGIPFPKGAVKDEQQVALFDSDGKEVPLQSAVLSRYWDDGSIRWLLLDFQVNVPAWGVAYFTLRYGEEIIRRNFPSLLSFEEKDGVVSVNTGALRFSVSKSFLSNIEMKAKRGWKRISSGMGDMMLSVGPPPNPEYLPIVTGGGRNRGSYYSHLDPDVKVVVEDRGPLRVQVKVEGWHVREDGKRFGPFILRVNAFAGKPYIQVYHTFVNSDLPERGLIVSVGVRLPLKLKGAKRVSFGSEPVETAAVKEDQVYYLLQDGWNHYMVVGDGQKEFKGQSGGWLDVSGQDRGVAVAFRNWAQLFPKELKLQEDTLSVWMYPEDGVGPADLRRAEQRNSPEFQEYRKKQPKLYGLYMEPCEGFESRHKPVASYRKALEEGDLVYLANHSALGFSRTHEFYILFHGSKASKAELTRFATACNKPLLAYALDRWYDSTEVLGHFGYEDREHFPMVENYFAKKVDWALRHQNEWFPSHFWGIINYGGMQSTFEKDHYSGTIVPGQWLWYLSGGWVNNEVDAPKHLFLYYLRTGNRRVFDFAESVVRQMMDVVTAHANLPDFDPPATLPKWKKGGMHRHEYDPYGGGVLENHTWNEGLINYYYLTGYRRAYDVAMETGEFALRLNGNANRIKQWRLYEKQFDRNASNNWRILLKCYELTGEERFKREADRWREYYLKNSPYSYQGLPQATFMTVRYLLPTYELDYRLFSDERVAEEIMKIARWLTAEKEGDEMAKEGFLAPALSFDLTRGGGPLEELIKQWWMELSSYQRENPQCTSKQDFTSMSWNEFEPLFFYLHACKDAGFTEKRPPK